MRAGLLFFLVFVFGLASPDIGERQATSLLIRGGLVVDGTGRPGRVADVRVESGRIAAVGRLAPREGERVLEAAGMVVAPGFIDAHSHTSGSMEESPTLESQVRQGITTAIVGQDGGSTLPISQFFADVAKFRPAINFATFAGHGSLRRLAMGEDYKRPLKDAELQVMKDGLDQAMKDGALGLSSGLEYDPGYYSNTVELIELAKVASRYGGMYISHVREDGTHGMQQALEELKLIAKEAKLPAQISHIKLAVAAKWFKAGDILKWIAESWKQGYDLTADVYPYLYWQSTITVLTLDRNWENREVWVKALADVNGPGNVLLTRYTPDPAWQGKTIEEISKSTGKDAIEVIQEIVRKTHGPNATGSESIVCTSMNEQDLGAFLKDPNVMFCSDGSHGGSHPRGAGSFPRIFGRYVRELKTLSLEEAVRKATSFPAHRFGLSDRGLIQVGKAADIVVFDPKRIVDRATTSNSRAMSEGVIHVLVNGVPVLESETMTGARPGLGLRRGQP